jgi:hypothetical protein
MFICGGVLGHRGAAWTVVWAGAAPAVLCARGDVLADTGSGDGCAEVALCDSRRSEVRLVLLLRSM